LQQSGANDRNDEQIKSHDRLPRDRNGDVRSRHSTTADSIPVILARRKDRRAVSGGWSRLLEPAK